MSMQIIATVDGKKVTLREAQKTAKYLMKHRKEYKTEDDVRVAFDDYVRKLRGDDNA